MLTFSFDDAHISTYKNAFPILKKYNQNGVVGAVADWTVPPQASRININQLLKLQTAGWEIASHSQSHANFNEIPQTYKDGIIVDWTKVSGTTNTFMASYTYQHLPSVMTNGNYLKRTSSLAQVKNKANGYFHDSEKQRLYLNSGSKTHPGILKIQTGSVEHELEISKKFFNQAGLVVKNFMVPYSRWNQSRRSLAQRYYHSASASYHDGYMNEGK